MHDSYVELSLPFRSQPDILERYIATSGGIRLGKLFEDLDSLAGDAAYTHVLGGRPSAAEQNNTPIFIVSFAPPPLTSLAVTTAA
jgi:acyl-coenzyme A thioesterase 9